jgi:hypothetical protein
MQKEMSRKEFLATLGFGMASILGFSSIIHLLTGKSFGHHSGSSRVGFGSGAYGGGKE